MKGGCSAVVLFLCLGLVVESGDELSVLYEKEALLLINHQSTGDVPSIMASLHGRQRVGGTLMWIMDEMFRFTHFGAASTLRKDFFIRQVHLD